MSMRYDRLGLLREATARYTLGDPLHGPDHWLAVEDAAVELAAELGGDAEVGSAFAILHDCCRESSWHDPEHGARAAALAMELNHRFFALPNTRLNKLLYALEFHDAGLVSLDLNVSVCWAADRIELRRVGIEPSREFFCPTTWPLVERMLARQGVS